MDDVIDVTEFTITVTSPKALEWIVVWIESEISELKLSYKHAFSINDSATFKITTDAAISWEDATKEHESLLKIVEEMGFKKLGGSRYGVGMETWMGTQRFWLGE